MTSLIIAGCQTRVVTSDGRPMPPEPRPAPARPVGAEPDLMTLMWGAKPIDTDGNGFPDTMKIITGLFAENHPIAIPAEGTFVFVLYKQGEAREADAEPIATWRFDEEEVVRARGRVAWGAAYSFSLNLLNVGTDRLPAMTADLRGWFEPANGSGIIHCSDNLRRVQLGRHDYAAGR